MIRRIYSQCQETATCHACGALIHKLDLHVLKMNIQKTSEHWTRFHLKCHKHPVTGTDTT